MVRPQIVEIARGHHCIAGIPIVPRRTRRCSWRGFISKDVPHTLAALCRAMGVCKTLVAYECGAMGPGKDCAYENDGQGDSGDSCFDGGQDQRSAHEFVRNVAAVVCDLWANEAIEYHQLFGGTTSAVFAEMLGYEAAAMNASLELGYQKEYQASLIYSDRYRSPQGFVLCPDIAWKIGKAVVENNQSFYSRGRAAALTCGRLMLGDPF